MQCNGASGDGANGVTSPDAPSGDVTPFENETNPVVSGDVACGHVATKGVASREVAPFEQGAQIPK